MRGHQHGLTLLEMLLVIFILSVVSLSAVALVDRQEDSIRLDETRSKLRQIRTAVLGRGPFSNEGAGPSGHVADLGALPGTVDDLVRVPTAAAHRYGMKAPHFDDTTVLDAVQHGVPKGWRGPYLTLPPSEAPTEALFRDGWERGARDDPDHGWVLTRSGNDLGVASAGPDGSLGEAGAGTGDELAVAIVHSDWRAELDGWRVEAVGLPPGEGGFFARLLVAHWDAATANWRWSRRDSLTAAADGEGRATLVFSFAGAQDGSVPLGRHLLVLGQAGAVYDAGTAGSPVHVSAHVRLRARHDPPAVTLHAPAPGGGA